MCDQPHVITFDTLTEEFKPLVGGKCGSLGTMSQVGLPVPPGFAVTTRVYADARKHSGTYQELTEQLRAVTVGDTDGLTVAAARAREMVKAWEIPAEIEDEIRATYQALCDYCGVPDLPVAVRSSATAEDTPDASFAGEHDTYLWVRGADSVLEHVKACWASLFTDRAIAYRTEFGYDHTDVDMAVAVQKMVRPRSAGVAFTLDPTNGDRSGICIDSAWGFGEGVVSGEVTPDNFLVDKVMYQIGRRVISPKTHAYQLQGDRVVKLELDAGLAETPSLTDDEIVAIARLARSAEKHYGCPQDIEWAVDDDLPAGEDVVLLQARPETVWSKKSTAVNATQDLMSSIVSTLVNPLYSRSGGSPAS
ncbi:MAG: PEP/pyruvate-binding domain-containing protein [Nocardioidaceae bacterium]|nr:PEP/pyruvate-binding domain-containing protein [Nocardioidaceae bacterium]